MPAVGRKLFLKREELLAELPAARLILCEGVDLRNYPEVSKRKRFRALQFY